MTEYLITGMLLIGSIAVTIDAYRRKVLLLFAASVILIFGVALRAVWLW